MRIKWPWVKNRAEIVGLKTRFDEHEDYLQSLRIMRPIRVTTYKTGMSLRETGPEPIRLENLQRRIEALEEQLGDQPVKEKT